MKMGIYGSAVDAVEDVMKKAHILLRDANKQSDSKIIFEEDPVKLVEKILH